MAAGNQFTDRVSPAGDIRVAFDAMEPRMSIWILAPIVIRTRDEHVVVRTPIEWHGPEPEFGPPGQVTLRLTNYPNGWLQVAVVVDVEAETWWFEDRPENAQAVAGLSGALDRHELDDAIEQAQERLAAGQCPLCLNPTSLVSAGRGHQRCIICDNVWDESGLVSGPDVRPAAQPELPTDGEPPLALPSDPAEAKDWVRRRQCPTCGQHELKSRSGVLRYVFGSDTILRCGNCGAEFDDP